MRRFASVVALLVVGLFTGGLAVADPAGADGIEIPDREHFHLFLLVGQSNMAGRGQVEEEDRTPDPRVLSLNKEGKWVPAVDPLHFDKPAVVGVGLGKTFGRIISRTRPDVVIGLIPCAVGGSPIDSWQPGARHDQTNSHPWDDMVKRVHPALEQGTLKGILWHQGESDSSAKLAPGYERKLHDLIRRLRTEFDAEDVPFIAGQMGEFAGRDWNEFRRQVDQAHRELPEKVARTAFVSSDGLSDKGDKVHFDAASYRELGRRYARAYLQLADEGVAVIDGRIRLERSVLRDGFDGTRCWVHARAGVIPPRGTTGPGSQGLAVITTQELLLSGSDVFYELHSMTSEDGGEHWTDPAPQVNFARQMPEPGKEVTVCDFTPAWHAASQTLLGTGQTVWYENNRVMRVRPRAPVWSTYDVARGVWNPWQRLTLPDEPRFRNAGSGSVQRADLPNGEVLLPIYFKEPEATQFSTTVCRCRFDGETLTYIEHGNELTVPVDRGLAEPSLIRFGERFYLTLRNDQAGYVSVSEDGLTFTEPREWRFDDGSRLGNYNTQQHWLTIDGGLYLVYTRRGADNDHVFRHRAPLFIGRVDPERLVVLRSTEAAVVPEFGARLGNFGVTRVSDRESWVVVSEWMQPRGVEKYGSNNRIWLVRLRTDAAAAR